MLQKPAYTQRCGVSFALSDAPPYDECHHDDECPHDLSHHECPRDLSHRECHRDLSHRESHRPTSREFK